MKLFFRILSILMILFSCISLPAGAPAQAQGADYPRLTCLNIGKADCMLLCYGQDAYLIDTGYAHTYAALETMLSAYEITRLNGVILTHCHEDHDGGMEALAQSTMPVDHWYASAIYYDVKESKHPARQAAAQRGQQAEWLTAGMILPLGPDGQLQVLGPLQVNQENENNNSLVLRFSSPHGSILLAGDMKEEEERELLLAGMLSPSDVLKVGHHGDNKATSQAFLRVVQPRVSIILTHSFEERDTPSPATLSRLRSAGSSVFVSQSAKDALQITLKDGDITVEDISWNNVPAAPEGLSLSLNTNADMARIENQGKETVNLSGFQLFSSKGEDIMPLPDYLLYPGESFLIGSRSTDLPMDLLWDKKQIWHEKKRDMAILLDPYGRILARTDNGLPE